ncbi:MAG: ABC transporter permease [Bacteroidetes bacterium]|nr:ABC transporter permease [Bacteroidota bacterium]
MLTNYLKIALRNLRKHKGYTFINITGLAVGLACCLLIVLFVRDELSYDRYHDNADRIYRITLDALLGEQEIHGPISPAPMAQALVNDFPEVVQATRLFTFTDETLVRYQANRFVEERFFFGDSTFFEVFTFPLLQGDPKTALVEPNTVVLTESTARKYFGQENPIGQTLRVNEQTDYEVTGVMADVPTNSHFHFDFLGSLGTLDNSRNPIWVSNNFRTYFLLAEGHSPEALEAKFPAMVENYAGPQVEQILGITIDQFFASGGRFAFQLQALTDVHLHSQFDFEIEPNGDITYVYAFSVIAFLILLIACINFMNLATARSANRAKEVGVRKVLGSNRRQLTLQFLMESMLLSVIALGVALVLAAVLLPVFNNLSGKALQIDYLDGFMLSGVIGLAVLVGLLAGSYPAFFLASFSIVNVLKGQGPVGMKSSGLRSGLVVFQFVISIALMIGTAMVYRQVDFIQNKRLGFEKEHVIVLERFNALGPQQQAFKQQIQQHPNVVAVAAANTLPGRSFGDTSFIPEGAPPEDIRNIHLLYTDFDLLETLNLELVDGRFFSRDFATDSTAIVLNEAAVKELGWTEAVGKRLVSPSFSGGESQFITVVGVVKDFHFESLRQAIGPLGLFIGRNLNYLTVRIQPGDVSGTLAAFEAQWKTFAPEQPFTYSFLDRDVDALYQADQRTGSLFGTFALLAIMIACLGLFGLAAFTAEQRTKEIGVRKVLGASVGGIVLLLSKEFTKLVALAFVVAAPLAYFATNRWLQDFAFQADFSWWIFVLAGLAALTIAWLTVSYQSIRAALTNPVEALRYE